MLEVAGQPFIAWPLRQLAAAGFRRVVLCIGYRGDVLRDYVGDGDAFGLDVSYVDDGPTLLGTLGAVRSALPLLDYDVPVLYGDTYLTVDFAAVIERHRASGAAMTMTVLRNDGRWDRSNARVSGGRVVAYAKDPSPRGAEWIDYGFSVFRASALRDSTASDLSALVGDLAASGQVGAWPVSERFYEIGTPESLQEAAAYLRRRPNGGGERPE